MSLSAKAFFGASCVIAVASIGGVHYSQIREREVSEPPPPPWSQASHTLASFPSLPPPPRLVTS